VLFQRMNEGDPERVFTTVHNGTATALAANQWVAWDALTLKDGISVVKPLGELLASGAGVVVETIPAGLYGLVQVWGYRSGARCSGGSGLVTSKISEGTVLVMKTSGFAAYGMHALDSAAVTYPYHLFPVGIAMAPKNTAAYATRATTWVSNVFVKCL
jgi:hypothetical protein